MFRFDRRLLLNFDWVMLLAVFVVAALGLTGEAGAFANLVK